MAAVYKTGLQLTSDCNLARSISFCENIEGDVSETDMWVCQVWIKIVDKIKIRRSIKAKVFTLDKINVSSVFFIVQTWIFIFFKEQVEWMTRTKVSNKRTFILECSLWMRGKILNVPLSLSCKTKVRADVLCLARLVCEANA